MSLRAFSVSVRAQNGVWLAEDGIWYEKTADKVRASDGGYERLAGWRS